MISIKVYDSNGAAQELDLSPDTNIDLEYLFPAFDDKLEGSDFSLPFKIPFTDRNRALLGYAEHLNTDAAGIPEQWRCDVYDDRVLYAQDAKLKLLNHSGRFDNKDGSYNFNVSGIKGFFGTRAKGKSMKDLLLDGVINWDAAMDSREFAKDLMDGNQPQYEDRIRFAPVHMADFFDNSRNDYLGEYIYNEIVNTVVLDVAFNDGWIFGRPKPTMPTQVIAKGDPEYADYRTVPFYKLLYVVRKIFSEHGFTAEGNFFDYPDFDKLMIFNNFAIERYDFPFTYDVNTQIIPGNHMPDMSVTDFLAAIQNTCNLKIIFRSGFKVFLNFKEETIIAANVKDFSNKVDLFFESAQRNPAYFGGQALRWKWDGNDSYRNDKVKEIKDLNVIADVETFGDIAGLALPSPAITDYIYVAAENYYYNWNPTLSIWEPFSENQLDYEDGRMEVEYAPPLSPLCQYYGYDVPSNNILNKDMVGTRMLGSYINGAREQITNPFELRLFYIDQYSAGTYTDLPISFSHNYDTNGTKRVEVSLSWLAIDGLYNKFWKKWLAMLKNSFELQAKAHFEISDLTSLQESDILRIAQNSFLIKKHTLALPISEPSSVSLVKY